MVERSIGDWSAAAQAYGAAIQRDPTTPVFHFRLGLVQEQMLEWAAATESYSNALALDDHHASWFMRLAKVKDRLFDFDGARDAYLQAIARDPSNESYRLTFIRFSTKTTDWQAVSHHLQHLSPHGNSDIPSVIYGPREARSLVHHIRDFLDNDHLNIEAVREVVQGVRRSFSALPVEWWMCLHWKLIYFGAFSLAYEIKDIAAQALLNQRSDSVKNGVTQFLDVTKALAYLGREDEALEYLRSAIPSASDNTYSRQASMKLACDISLLAADVDAFQQCIRLQADPNTGQTRASFKSLIHDKSVAVVGPADTDLENGRDIDEHDVIVRTNYVPNRVDVSSARKWGSRTDVAYYNVGFERLRENPVSQALTDPDFKMAVLRRPTNLSRYGDPRAHTSIRLLPAEFSAHFRAAAFAIPRIVYDLLRQRPRAITIFNIDLFTRATAYRLGYKRAGADSSFHGFPHDFRTDFVLLQRLHKAGRLEGDSIIESIWRNPLSNYISTLDAKS